MVLTGQAKTDYQRDYMRRRRAKLAQSARLDSQPKGPLPDDEHEQAALLEQNQELIERLTRVTRERDRALPASCPTETGWTRPPQPLFCLPQATRRGEGYVHEPTTSQPIFRSSPDRVGKNGLIFAS